MQRYLVPRNVKETPANYKTCAMYNTLKIVTISCSMHSYPCLQLMCTPGREQYPYKAPPPRKDSKSWSSLSTRIQYTQCTWLKGYRKLEFHQIPPISEQQWLHRGSRVQTWRRRSHALGWGHQDGWPGYRWSHPDTRSSNWCPDAHPLFHYTCKHKA